MKLVTEKQQSDIELALYGVCGKLRDLSMQACRNNDPDLVHMLVSEERRLARLAQTITRRMGI